MNEESYAYVLLRLQLFSTAVTYPNLFQCETTTENALLKELFDIINVPERTEKTLILWTSVHESALLNNEAYIFVNYNYNYNELTIIIIIINILFLHYVEYTYMHMWKNILC